MAICFCSASATEKIQPVRESADSVRVTITWVDGANVYVATSDDIPGLILESADLGVLKERVLATIPELVELNGTLCQGVRH